ncbi:hypothetical protein HDU96_000540 [Phlyctochytrium bullatum]|nr:hypothetical protein HDU96_000540 [Phlyctochytrium bullatum]
MDFTTTTPSTPPAIGVLSNRRSLQLKSPGTSASMLAMVSTFLQRRNSAAVSSSLDTPTSQPAHPTDGSHLTDNAIGRPTPSAIPISAPRPFSHHAYTAYRHPANYPVVGAPSASALRHADVEMEDAPCADDDEEEAFVDLGDADDDDDDDGTLASSSFSMSLPNSQHHAPAKPYAPSKLQFHHHIPLPPPAAPAPSIATVPSVSAHSLSSSVSSSATAIYHPHHVIPAAIPAEGYIPRSRSTTALPDSDRSAAIPDARVGCSAPGAAAPITQKEQPRSVDPAAAPGVKKTKIERLVDRVLRHDFDELLDIATRAASSVIQCNPPPPSTTPIPHLRSFIQSAIRSSGVGPSVVVAATQYLVRLARKLPPTARGMHCTAHRIFLASLVLATKVLHDRPIRNRAWAGVHAAGLFSLMDVNLMERQLLGLLEFGMGVGPEEVVEWARAEGILEGWEDEEEEEEEEEDGNGGEELAAAVEDEADIEVVQTSDFVESVPSTPADVPLPPTAAPLPTAIDAMREASPVASPLTPAAESMTASIDSGCDLVAFIDAHRQPTAAADWDTKPPAQLSASFPPPMISLFPDDVDDDDVPLATMHRSTAPTTTSIVTKRGQPFLSLLKRPWPTTGGVASPLPAGNGAVRGRPTAACADAPHPASLLLSTSAPACPRDGRRAAAAAAHHTHHHYHSLVRSAARLPDAAKLAADHPPDPVAAAPPLRGGALALGAHRRDRRRRKRDSFGAAGAPAPLLIPSSGGRAATPTTASTPPVVTARSAAHLALPVTAGSPAAAAGSKSGPAVSAVTPATASAQLLMWSGPPLEDAGGATPAERVAGAPSWWNALRFGAAAGNAQTAQAAAFQAVAHPNAA